MLRVVLILAVLLLPRPAFAQHESVTQLLDRSMTRMGGDSVLRNVRTMRMDMLTQWLSISFADRPFADRPSYERHVDLRDYTTAAWRNTRYFNPAATTPGVVDVVRDTIAARLMPRAQGAAPTWGALNLAYVDERRELFAFAPERLIPALRADRAVRLLGDTTIDGAAHHRLAATVDGWPTMVFLRQSDALPTLVRFRADETNDFGLAPWAEHEVEFWYSSWTRLPSGLVLARQRDVRRVGKPYKRMTVLTAVVNAEAPADSFAISDSVTAAYLANEKRPMWQATLDGVARIEREVFATFPPLTGTLGAVRIGGRWVVLEAAQSAGAMALVADWLGRNGGGAPIGGAIASNVFTGNGGAPWFATRSLPVYAAPGAAGTLATILGSRSGFTTIATPRWVRIGTDSLWVEPISVPDMQGTVALYSPTLRWAWAPFIGSPVHGPEQSQFLARLESRGMRVELIGGGRTLVGPKP